MKYVFIDMDGTIAEWGYPDGRISGEYKFGDYFGKQPINDVIAEIYNRFNDPKEYSVLVISAVPNTKAIIEKNAWLNNFFVIPYENRIFIQKNEDKVDIIDFYLRQVIGIEPKGNAILIDDKKEWLTKAEEYGIEIYHPTKIIGLYQTRMAELQEKHKQEQQKKEKSENNNILEDNEQISTDAKMPNTSNEDVIEEQ